MKTLIVLLGLVAFAVAHPGGHGDGGGEHATQILHGAPVVTKVFKNPGLGYFNNYAPKIDGPLITRGIGKHVGGDEKHY